MLRNVNKCQCLINDKLNSNLGKIKNLKMVSF